MTAEEWWKESTLRCLWLTNTKNLFSSQAGNHVQENAVLDCVRRRVTQDMNEMLLAPFTGEEVLVALESIGDL